ncbi:hypothetical protein EVAR_91056_1 [Eumeta japonica]|uniref:Uncharacterized protein n=1 Tax=Eumeta variegata TaxID=151549 RepID=A0A4C1Z8C7_EUMVA|nr:hypothetical protein EVAR_91056_1 [Eumeta japonica]
MNESSGSPPPLPSIPSPSDNLFLLKRPVTHRCYQFNCRRAPSPRAGALPALRRHVLRVAVLPPQGISQYHLESDTRNAPREL